MVSRGLAVIRSRAPFALAVFLADLALYNLIQLILLLQAHPFPDFLLFWAAGRAAVAHGPAAVYSKPAFDAAVRAVWGTGPPWPYLNPPVLAWLLIPLTLLPFGLAYGLWIAASATALGWAAWLTGHGVRFVLSALGFLPTFVALGSGQVAPLILLALVAATRLEARNRQVGAGAVLAVLAVKPQLGLLLPVAILAAGRWRAPATAAVIAIALAGATLLTLGGDGTRSWLSAVRDFSDNPYFLRWSLVPLVGDTGWWAALVVVAVAVGLAARRWRDDLLTVYGVGVTGSILVNHYLTPSDLVMLLLPAWALARAGGRAAVVGALLWLAGWVALFLPAAVIGAEVLTLLALNLPVVPTAPAQRATPAPAR
jgi:hypothetical protein